MRNRPLFCVVIMGVLLTATSLYAQIYRYIDDTGQTRWTDDLNRVPLHQRQTAAQFEDVEADAPQTGKKKLAAPVGKAQNSIDFKVTRESILRERAELENQYQHLKKERQRIEKMKANAGDNANQAALNKQILEFNVKTDKYELRKQSLSEKVQRYNRQLTVR